MSIRHLGKDYAVGPQITPADVARLKAQGFATLVCNRPDGESEIPRLRPILRL